MPLFLRLFLLFFVLSSTTACKTVQAKYKNLEDDFVSVFVKETEAKIPDTKFDSGLMLYRDQFLADAEKYGVHITDLSRDALRRLEYVDQLSVQHDGNVIAACSRFYTWQKDSKVRWMVIEVLKDKAQKYTGGEAIRLKELLYHEFFHCFLNKGHLPEGKEGIMAPVLTRNSQRVYLDWDGLVEEMFSPEYLELIPDAQ
jgi:hypothetical protein